MLELIMSKKIKDEARRIKMKLKNCYNCQYWNYFEDQENNIATIKQCEKYTYSMMNDPKSEKGCFKKRKTILISEQEHSTMLELLEEAKGYVTYMDMAASQIVGEKNKYKQWLEKYEGVRYE